MRQKDTVELYRYWDEIRKGREAPDRADVSPAALGRLLSSIMLLQRAPDGAITFRLAGTRLCSIRCHELKGSPFSFLFRDSDQAAIERIADSVISDNALVVLDVLARPQGGPDFVMEVLLLPLADETTRAIGIASASGTPQWLGLVPAEMTLRGIRYMNPESSLPFLQNRPSVTLLERAAEAQNDRSPGFRIVSGSGQPGPARALRAFRVLDGGKK